MGGGGVPGGASDAVTTGAGRSRVMSSTSAGSWASAPTTYGGSGSGFGLPAAAAAAAAAANSAAGTP